MCYADGVVNRGEHTLCDKLMTVIGQTNLTTVATVDMPWQKAEKSA